VERSHRRREFHHARFARVKGRRRAAGGCSPVDGGGVGVHLGGDRESEDQEDRPRSTAPLTPGAGNWWPNRERRSLFRVFFVGSRSSPPCGVTVPTVGFAFSLCSWSPWSSVPSRNPRAHCTPVHALARFLHVLVRARSPGFPGVSSCNPGTSLAYLTAWFACACRSLPRQESVFSRVFPASRVPCPLP